MANLVAHVDASLVKRLMTKQGSGRIKAYSALDTALNEGQLRQCRDAFIKLLPMVDARRQAEDSSVVPLVHYFSPAAAGYIFSNTLDTHDSDIPEGIVWFVIRSVHGGAANEYFPGWSPAAAAAAATATAATAAASVSTEVGVGNNTAATSSSGAGAGAAEGETTLSAAELENMAAR